MTKINIVNDRQIIAHKIRGAIARPLDNQRYHLYARFAGFIERRPIFGVIYRRLEPVHIGALYDITHNGANRRFLSYPGEFANVFQGPRTHRVARLLPVPFREIRDLR